MLHHLFLLQIHIVRGNTFLGFQWAVMSHLYVALGYIYTHRYESSHTSHERVRVVSKMWGVSTDMWFFFNILFPYMSFCVKIQLVQKWIFIHWAVRIEFVRIYVGKMPYFCWISIIQSIAWILVFDCRLFLCAYQKESGKKWKLMELKSSYV